MSESPGFVTARQPTRKYLPQAVPKSLLPAMKKTGTSGVMMDTCASKHGIILDFRLSKRRAVGRDNDKFGFATSNSLKTRLVAQVGLSTLHNKRQPAVDRLDGLFLQLRRKNRLLVSGHTTKKLFDRG